MLNEMETNTYSQEAQVETKPEQQPTESAKEQNFRAMRERAEAAERARLDAEKRANELEQILRSNMYNQNQPSQKIQIEDDDIGISDDSFIEGKDYKKHYRALKKQNDENKKKLDEMHYRYEVSLAEIKAKAKYNDFDTVVNEENLLRLQKSKPAVYKSIMSNPDISDRCDAAYDFLKYGMGSQDVYAQENRKIEENKVKPRSAASSDAQTADTPLARLGDYDRRVLTKEQRDEIMKRVNQYKMG
jgi:hypothetical protein